MSQPHSPVSMKKKEEAEGDEKWFTLLAVVSLNVTSQTETTNSQLDQLTNLNQSGFEAGGVSVRDCMDHDPAQTLGLEKRLWNYK